MQQILLNIRFMSFNIFLACIPVVFCTLMVKEKSRLLKLIYGAIWLLFLPNTLYVITDITHLVEDWHKVPLLLKGIDIFQYLILVLIGICTLIYSVYPIEKILQKKKGKHTYLQTELLLYLLNFLIGFGIVLGRVDRVNSWEVITNIPKVIYTSVHTVTSLASLLLVIFFGLFSSIIYFSFKDFIIKNRINKSS